MVETLVKYKMKSKFTMHMNIHTNQAYIFFGLLWLLFGTAHAQEEYQADVLYKKDGEVLSCIIAEVMDSKIQYKIFDNVEGPVYNILKEDVVLAFKNNGSYFIPSNPAAQWVQAASTDVSKIVTKDHQILPATFVEVQGDNINYQEENSGENESITQSEVLAIIRKDGSHQLFDEPKTVATAFDQLGEMNTYSSIAVRDKLKMNENDYKEFTQKALFKAENLGDYFAILCSKTEDDISKRSAENSAKELFVNDSTNWVEVSSLNRKEKDQYRVRDYLKRIRLLDYDEVKLTWRNINYITKLKLGSDGNYYGVITVQQTFRGFRDGKLVYQDVTQKDIEVQVTTIEVEKEGKTEIAWDVFLSNIGVQQTNPK